jgi:hypothetical protein
MANLIQLRRDLAANWADVNPILSQGEPGVELDTRKVKIGNGVTAWNDLDYISTSDLPPDSDGYLRNDSGNISWVPLNLFSGNYNDLTDKPDIPTDVNELSDNDGLLAGAPIVTELENTISDLLAFDFGPISNRTIRNRLEWILFAYNYDNGTINSPANIDHDAGTLI